MLGYQVMLNSIAASYKYCNQKKWMVYQQQHQSGAWFIIIGFIKAW